MNLRCFIIPVADIESASAKLNAFLASRRVLDMQRRFVEAGSASFWAIDLLEIESAPEQAPIGARKGVE